MSAFWFIYAFVVPLLLATAVLLAWWDDLTDDQ